MEGQFPLFNSPIDLAHHFWRLLMQPGDRAIDATCGNGHDTLFLARICKEVISLDIQESALLATRERLKKEGITNVSLIQASHDPLPKGEFPIRLIVYNLGYLPGGNQEITTLVATTLNSVQEALDRIEAGGMVSITCYPGHPEGAIEQEALLSLCEKLDQRRFCASHHTWKNRKRGPSLLTIQRKG